jgi:hypothetical protein
MVLMKTEGMMRRRLLVLTAIGFLGASLAMADDDDPPSRAARLSFLAGTVSFQPGSVEDWVPATLNRPMTTGDRLWTEAGGRAEMHIGSAALRLNGRTSFAFLNLEDRMVQVQVSVGTMNVRLRNLADDETFEIDTPQLALTLLRAGEYRVDVNEDGAASIVSVRGGDAEANAGSQAVAVRARDQLRVSGPEDEPVLDRRDIPPADAFDNFCENRDRREDMSQSARYVSRDIPGYADLDAAGAWREAPGYGMVWYPAGLQVGWAPYRYGHWAWIAPWGWTWVDDAPWGYAPFHYGRWVFAGGGWGWVPGPVGPRPVYAPAMVAWVGGGGFSVGIGVGVGPAVGWFALGPREVWVPSYHYSPAYIQNVNVTNTVIVNRTVINNVNVNNVTYVNRNVAGAVTVMPQNQMVAGRPVGTAGVAATPQMVAGAQVQTRAAVVPDRTAVLGARAGVAAPTPPASVSSRQIVARNTPPPAPVPFAQQRTQLQQNPGQPVPRTTLAQMPRGPQGGPTPGQAPTGAQGVQPGPRFRTVGPPRTGNQGGPAPSGGVGGGQGGGGIRPGPGAPTPGARVGVTPGVTPNGPSTNGPGTPNPAVTPRTPTTPPGPGTPQPEVRRPPEIKTTPTSPTPPGPGTPKPEIRTKEPAPETKSTPPPTGGGGGKQAPKENKQKQDGKRRPPPPEKDEKGKER